MTNLLIITWISILSIVLCMYFALNDSLFWIPFLISALVGQIACFLYGYIWR